jgi:hypothetical protein
LGVCDLKTVEGREMFRKLLSENLKGRSHLKDISIDGRLILDQIDVRKLPVLK